MQLVSWRPFCLGESGKPHFSYCSGKPPLTTRLLPIASLDAVGQGTSEPRGPPRKTPLLPIVSRGLKTNPRTESRWRARTRVAQVEAKPSAEPGLLGFHKRQKAPHSPRNQGGDPRSGRGQRGRAGSTKNPGQLSPPIRHLHAPRCLGDPAECACGRSPAPPSRKKPSELPPSAPPAAARSRGPRKSAPARVQSAPRSGRNAQPASSHPARPPPRP